MEEEIYKMIFKRNYEITEDDIFQKVQELYKKLKIFKETDDNEFIKAFNDEISSFMKNRKALNNKIIRVLGEEFIRNNRNKCKFIINNKKCNLIESDLLVHQILKKMKLKSNCYLKIIFLIKVICLKIVNL